MNIISGLFPNCVLQRTNRNSSDARIRAEFAGKGELRVRVTKSGRPLPGFHDKKLADVRKGTVEFRLAGLPAGGPYRVELTVAPHDQLVVNNVLVGDVWIAAGQSNMQGCGRLTHAAKPLPMVRAFYMDDRWDVARDPIHNMWACVDQVHIDLAGGVRPALNKITGTGPAVGFVQEMWRRTGVPQGVLACAHGGTSMDQWDPAKKSDGTKSLYGATLRRLEKNGGRCAGMIWYQGESDALTPGWPAVYTAKMVRFVRVLRRDTREPRLPVAVVQIGRVLGLEGQAAAWNSVQDQERRLSERIPQLAVVPAVDLQLDDGIHIGGPDNNRLGQRLAQAMCALTGQGRRKEKLPITLRAVKKGVDPANGLADITVEFDNVVGRLVAPGRPAGFTATGPIFNIRLEGSRAVLKTGHPANEAAPLQVAYGSGTDPYCNIVDEAGRALPVFGPIIVGKLHALTPYVNRLRVTASLPSAGQLDYPTNLDQLSWRTYETPANFCDLHPLPEDRLVYFSCRLDVPEKMKLLVRLGYDGPVKLWVDGHELFHDPNGTNPANADKAKVPFTAEPGQHTVLVALGSNSGKAWGISLRFERLDVPLHLLKQGPEHYRMPTIVV